MLLLMEEIFMINQSKIILKHDNIRKIATGQGDDYTTECLLDYNYFKKHYRLIAIDLSKQQKLDVDPKAIFFIIKEAKETALDFSKGTVKVYWFHLVLI